MPSLAHRLRSAFSFGAVPDTAVPDDLETKARRQRGPLAKSTFVLPGQRDERTRPVALLRRWADTNEWVRIAVNRRKRQISQARWKIVRLDDPQAPPNPKVVDAVSALFRFVNPKRESLRSLLDMVLEDLLIFDAGVIEKEKTLGGGISALYVVDGATIVPDPSWTGKPATSIRYRQYVNDKLTAEFRNDELVYMMATPRSYTSIGWSPVETLARSIEADLYGDDFDYDMLRQTAPAGLIDAGSITPDQLEAFREYYESEIEGQRRVAIIGGYGVDAEGNSIQRSASWIPLQHTARDMERANYRTWLATKVAAAFELDLGVFNLTANLHKDTGAHQQSLTDEGHKALGALVEEFLTREIVYEFDENHGFQLSDLNVRDAAAQAELDKVYVSLGACTPNMILSREGHDPVPWGDAPWIVGKGPWTGGSEEGDRPTDQAATPGLNPEDAKPAAVPAQEPGDDKPPPATSPKPKTPNVSAPVAKPK